MDPDPPSSRDAFKIAIVCALQREFEAVIPLLDTVWDEEKGRFGKAYGDLNMYMNGRIGQHNVVVVCFPEKTMGKRIAASVAADLSHSYHELELVLLVGICGGVPKMGDIEIVLGDVIVSTSVVQYDFGRQYPDGFRRKKSANDDLRQAPMRVKSMLAIFGLDDMVAWLQEKTVLYLKDLQEKKPKYAYPGTATDRLFEPGYRHKHQNLEISPTCKCKDHKEELDPVCPDSIEAPCDTLGCDRLVPRKRLEERAASTDPDDKVFHPKLHFGPVASGDAVMKSGVDRDKIAESEGIIAFEMEAAGIWERLPTIVIKAVCDYSDSHKNKGWQDYSAATAASAAKAMLMRYIRTDDKESPVAPREVMVQTSPKPEPQWVLPLPSDPDFVDRPEIMAWLSEKSTISGARVALVGLGGIGKSQLAIRFADQVHKNSGWHVFWVNATTRRSLEQSYKDIADKLQLAQPADSLDTILAQVARWLRRESNGRWLVVLDNFDDSSILDANDPHLSALLPQSGNGFAVITSRSSQAAEQLTGNPKYILPVKAMSEEGALELFQTKLQDKCTSEEGLEVVRLLDCVPLAISQAAAYINRPASNVTVGEYLSKLQDNEERKKALLRGYTELSRYDDASNSILETWVITLEQIQRERPSAMDLLAFMSFFNPQAIPAAILKGYKLDPPLPRIKVGDLVGSSKSSFLSLVSRSRNRYEQVGDDVTFWVWRNFEHGKVGKEAEKSEKKKSWRPKVSSLAGFILKDRVFGIGEDEEDLGDIDELYEEDLGILLGYSLVTTTAKKDVLEMHPLVRYCTQGWLSEFGYFERWKRRFLMVMAAKYVPESSGVDYGVHLDALLQLEPEDPITARVWSFLFLKVAARWDHEGRNADARNLLSRLRAVGDEHLGEADDLTTSAMSFLIGSLWGHSQLEEAEELSVELLRRMEEGGAIDSREGVRCRERYSQILSALGRHEEAEKIIRSVLETSQETHGPRAAATHRSLGYHAAVLVTMGRHEEATQTIVRMLETDWEKIEWWDGGIETTVQNMARNPECEASLRKIVAAAEQVFRSYPVFKEHTYAQLHECLAICLVSQGKTDEAKGVVRRGMQLRAEVFPDSGIPMPDFYAIMLEQQGEYEEAEEVRRANVEYLAGQKDRYHEHLEAMKALGKLLYAQGKTDEGTELLWKVYMGRAESLGETHPKTVKDRQLYAEREALPDKFKRIREQARLLAEENLARSKEAGEGEE